MLASRDNLPLLAQLLAEQQRLETPVMRFSAAQDAGSHLQLTALKSQLIPISKPKPGEQYAFEVDLDSCTGCKSCVAACHSLNGLDEAETWRDVGLLVSANRARPFTQTVTTACHHCADPACLNGCPVLAYEKDPLTGIVRHLDDQCIGCSYCVLKCPYDVPKFSERLGIVRKCDMCHSRLAAGEAPACAQACPTQAIRIVTVSIASKDADEHGAAILGKAGEAQRGHSIPTVEVGRECTPCGSSRSFLPGAPDPSYTLPTTRYVSRRKLPDELIAADAAILRPQPPHWPLVIMLTLLPAAVGLASASVFLRAGEYFSIRESITLGSWIAGASGLGAAVFHLGQPLRAWRIFLGWRKSWLSREAIVFGLWFCFASAALFFPAFALPSAVVGIAGLACSAMIYVDTRRQFWRAEQTFVRIFGTAALFGTVLFVPPVAAALLVAKLAWEWRTHYDQSVSGRLQRGPLRRAAFARDMFSVITLVLLVTTPAWLALLTLAAGEVAERYLFFRAVDAPKMPGIPE
jgi:Fe-S-cluster-containing dehydrogenase component/DMSO reductase anchor subunit